MQIHFAGSNLESQPNITCTMQNEIRHSCIAVPHNAVYTPQIASYLRCIALPCDKICTVRIESHQGCSALP